MKKVLKILFATVFAVALAVMCVGCAGGADGDTQAKGLLVKKTNDGIYTVYGYIDDGSTTWIDIGAELEKKGIKQEYIIKSGAFEGNTSLVEVKVTGNVKEVEAGAFKNMHSLQKLQVPFIGKTINSDAFEYQSASASDKSVGRERTIAHYFGDEEYSAGSLVSINYGTGTASCYMPVSFYKVTVVADAKANGKDVYGIPMHAFNGAVNLTSIVIEGSALGEIGESAFNGCINLKSFTIPSTVKTIYKNAFASCTKLDKVYIDANASVDVKEGAFSNCSKMSYIGAKADSTPSFVIDMKAINSVQANAFNFGKESYKVINASTAMTEEVLKACFGDTKYTKQ